MGLKISDFFTEENYELSDLKIICCKKCLSHLCLSHFVASGEFTGASGQAYLVNKLINYEFYDRELEEKMITGTYLVQKVRCHQCKNKLGWYYKKSFDHREKYKEGKFVIELAYLKFINNNNSTKLLIDKVNQQKISKNSSSSNSSTASSVSSGDVKTNLSCPYSTKSFYLRNKANGSDLNNIVMNWKYKTSNNKNLHFGDVYNGAFLSRIINSHQQNLAYDHGNDNDLVDESLVDDEDDEIFIDT
jgi:hypothetical protein